MNLINILSYIFFIGLLTYFRGRLNESMLILFLAEIYLFAYTLIKFPGERGPLKNKKISLSFQIGTGIFLGGVIIGTVASFFFAAITGIRIESVLTLGFSLTFMTSFYLGLNAVTKRKEAYRYYGLSFEEDMVGPTDFSGNRSDSGVSDEFDTEKLLFLLNLEAPLTRAKLKERFHEISLLYHPDRLAQMSEKQRSIAEAEFKRLTNAKELLEKTL